MNKHHGINYLIVYKKEINAPKGEGLLKLIYFDLRIKTQTHQGCHQHHRHRQDGLEFHRYPSQIDLLVGSHHFAQTNQIEQCNIFN